MVCMPLTWLRDSRRCSSTSSGQSKNRTSEQSYPTCKGRQARNHVEGDREEPEGTIHLLRLPCNATMQASNQKLSAGCTRCSRCNFGVLYACPCSPAACQTGTGSYPKHSVYMLQAMPTKPKTHNVEEGVLVVKVTREPINQDTLLACL
jgi:hypothetical protein